MFLLLGLSLFLLGFAWVVVGIHALLLGRMPGKRLPRLVRQPRLWGAGALLVLAGAGSPSLLAVAVGLMALGHVMKSRR